MDTASRGEQSTVLHILPRARPARISSVAVLPVLSFQGTWFAVQCSAVQWMAGRAAGVGMPQEGSWAIAADRIARAAAAGPCHLRSAGTVGLHSNVSIVLLSASGRELSQLHLREQVTQNFLAIASSLSFSQCTVATSLLGPVWGPQAYPGPVSVTA